MQKDEIQATITSEEMTIIGEALMQYARKCMVNKRNSLSGYGKATSFEKSKQWQEKSIAAEELSTRLWYEFI
jgi:hypothetical protein